MTNLLDKPVLYATLSQFFVAPENMRVDDDVDDAIADLGETLLAGQWLPLFVRADGGAKPLAILDGRRRFLAFEHLDAAGKIPADHPIGYILCETLEEIAAAAVGLNVERLDPTYADLLLTVHRLLQEQQTPEHISRALGIEIKKVRQLAKLGSVDRRFLDAYKAEELELHQLRKVARISDPNAIEELAAALERDHWYFSNALQRLDAPDGIVTAKSEIVKIVPVDDYVAAGGQVEQDLFDEKPDQLLDVGLVNRLWTDRVRPIAEALQERGIKVHFYPKARAEAPEGTKALPWDWESKTGKKKIDAATADADALSAEAEKHRDAGDWDAWTAASIEAAVGRLQAFTLRAKPLDPKAAVLFAGRGGITIELYADEAEVDGVVKAKTDAHNAKTRAAAAEANAATVAVVKDLPQSETKLDIEGVANAHHERLTDLAGNAIALSLARNPAVAFDAQLAAQFQMCVLREYRGNVYQSHLPDRLLQIRVTEVGRTGDEFEQPIIDLLETWRQRYIDAKQHPFVWVQSLTGEEKGDLFALITAVQVNAREVKTTELRRATRAEAAHIADALDHDIRDLWKPDAPTLAAFYADFSKKQLLKFAGSMDAGNTTYAKMKQRDLADAVAELAMANDFVPPMLNFELAGDDQDEGAAPEKDAAE